MLDGSSRQQLHHQSLHSTDPGMACVHAASDGFTSLMIGGDRREEGRDRDRAGEAAGEEEKAREECETPERATREGAAR